MLTACGGASSQGGKTTETPLVEAPVFEADSAMSYVQQQCDFGPRVPGSEAHRACGDWIVAMFRSWGAEVKEQHTELAGYDGVLMPCRNIQARIGKPAEGKKPILVTAHWDSRAWADHDPNPALRRTPVMAANDGASGVAVMLEMARVLSRHGGEACVDFVCFDLEDQGTPDWEETDGSDDFWCLGSTYWAEQAFINAYTALYAINLDMVGTEGARFCQENFSLRYASSLVTAVWQMAERLGYADFFPTMAGGYVTDDHLPINRLAHIPAIDIIPHNEGGVSSFGPTWHTTSDTPEHVDAAALKAVGQTLVQLILQQ